MPQIRVLKAFTFSHQPTPGQKVADEIVFDPGVHDVSEEVANHPWIKSGADGRVATVDATPPSASASAQSRYANPVRS